MSEAKWYNIVVFLQYTDIETGSRVMEDEERIMTNLKKQHEEGRHIRYVLYHQEEAVEGIQRQSDG